MSQLDRSKLESVAGMLTSLRAVPTPTIANAIERLGIRTSAEGYTDPSIKCVFPELGCVIGFACTLTVRSATPGRHSSRKPYWDYVNTKFPKRESWSRKNLISPHWAPIGAR